MPSGLRPAQDGEGQREIVQTESKTCRLLAEIDLSAGSKNPQLLCFFELRFAQSDARKNYLSQILAKSLICNGLTLWTRDSARSQEVENRERERAAN